jgi:ribosome-binding protein aMBF1 (putative translation factor)
MADVKKFLDQSGVSTLWTRVAEEVAKVDTKVKAHDTAIETMQGQIEALEKGTYDDSELRGLIGANKTATETNAANIKKNTDAIGVLNGDVATSGSVAHTATAIAAAKVAEIVAGADASYDTLKEIADWILNDTTGAANMANDISALENKLAGIDTTVVAHVAAAIEAALKADGADKYALAADLNALVVRVKAIEDAGYQNAAQVGSAIDAKITALKLAESYDAKGAAATAESNAKAHADGLDSAMNVRVLALENIDHSKFEAAGAAATALSDAKAYTDAEVAKIQALTPAEIEAAIAAASQA